MSYIVHPIELARTLLSDSGCVARTPRFSRVADEINEQVVTQLGLEESTHVIAGLRHLIEILEVFTPPARANTKSRRANNAAKQPHKRPRLPR